MLRPYNRETIYSLRLCCQVNFLSSSTAREKSELEKTTGDLVARRILPASIVFLSSQHAAGHLLARPTALRQSSETYKYGCQVRRTARGPLRVGIRHEVRVRGVVLDIVVSERRRRRIGRANGGELCPVRRGDRGEGAHGAPDSITSFPANLTQLGRRPVQDDIMGFGLLRSHQPRRRVGGGAGRLLVLLG